MSTTRLEALQSQLVARGVKDVKFFFNPAALGTLSKAVDGAVAVLGAYLDGRCEPAREYVKPQSI